MTRSVERNGEKRNGENKKSRRSKCFVLLRRYQLHLTFLLAQTFLLAHAFNISVAFLATSVRGHYHHGHRVHLNHGANDLSCGLRHDLPDVLARRWLAAHVDGPAPDVQAGLLVAVAVVRADPPAVGVEQPAGPGRALWPLLLWQWQNEWKHFLVRWLGLLLL